MTQERVAVVGAGIVGLAHAWREAAHGARVTLFERSARAQGASVRNFGMVWPIGQTADRLDDALLSRALWEEFLAAAGVWRSTTGSLHVAVREDERRVLEEFATLAPDRGYRTRLLSGAETAALCPATATRQPLAGLFSETEIGVDPREVIAAAPGWLADRYGVTLEFGTTIVEAEPARLRSSDGREWDFDRVTVASGVDYQTLYPELFRRHALGRCKLLMLRTEPQPGGWRLGPLVASGLTLRHYPTFADCPGIVALRERVAAEAPELDKYGVHVMAAQNGAGEVVLGDSHEYGDEASPFDDERIADMILREIGMVLDLPSWRIAARWHGVYAFEPKKALQLVEEPAEGVTVVIATGGCGMTMSFGLAERMVVARRNGRSIASTAGAAS